MLSFPQSILKASYDVSLPGRSKIRYMEKGFSTKGNVDNGFINESQINIDMFSLLLNPEDSDQESSQNLNNEEIDFMNQVILDVSDGFEKLGHNYESGKQSNVNLKEYDEVSSVIQMNSNAQNLLQMTNQRFQDFNSLRNKFNNINIKVLENIEWFTNLTLYAQNEISHQASILGYPNTANICSQYQEWVFTAHTNCLSEILLSDSDDSYWRRYHQIDPQLSHICVRLCSLGVSEAEVERMLSVQKNIFSPHATNVGTDMLHARCVIRSSKNSK